MPPLNETFVAAIGEASALFPGPVAYIGNRTAEMVAVMHGVNPEITWARPANLPPVEGGYALIVISPTLTGEASLAETLQALPPLMAPFAAVVAALPETISDRAGTWGLLPYPTAVISQPDADYIPQVLVKAGYLFSQHARALGADGRHVTAAFLLQRLPENWPWDPEELWLCHVELLLQFAILSSQAEEEETRCGFLNTSQKPFYTAIYMYPFRHDPYRLQARLWALCGRSDVGSRLLRSVQYVTPDPETAALLERPEFACACPPPQSPLLEIPYQTTAANTKTSRRVLILTHDHSDYGLDTLYDGLCQVLGPENVVEFPWKPTLHGQRGESALGYPCLFDYPGAPRTPGQIEAELHAGEYDLILHADVVQQKYRDTIRRFLAAAPGIPVVVYDTWDNLHNLLPNTLEYLGIDNVLLYFKREMVAGFPYGDNARPLPFGYPDRLVPAELPEDRPRNLFWAGKRLFGLRPLYLDWLAPQHGLSPEQKYIQSEYARALDESRIGLSMFGYGFDTVRYWELPAHGVMMLAERPPILIPHDFQDRVHAVFFDSLDELDAAIDHYLARPEETAAIAAAGRRHFLQHHTSSARARQFLAHITHAQKQD